MKIGIIGTRGIPNHYGGFEQFAEHVSVSLVEKGHEVYVYNSSNHPYLHSEYHGVKLVHCFDPENKIGTAGQFIYDLNCILDARGKQFDIILQLGYTSSSIWHFLLPKSSVVITNMDGLEWKRSKYHKWVQRFLKKAEHWAVQSSDVLIADSVGIQQYLEETYQVDSTYIAYGATPFIDGNEESINALQLRKYAYYLVIARFEPENNLEMIMDGFLKSKQTLPLVLIGGFDNKYGQYLYKKYSKYNILFMGPIYDLQLLNNIRHYCKMYFHGHSVGGTNPSLLEAMACKAPICAHQNRFNQAILNHDAYYFSSSEEVCRLLHQQPNFEKAIANNFDKIKQLYTWKHITGAYENVMMNAKQ